MGLSGGGSSTPASTANVANSQVINPAQAMGQGINMISLGGQSNFPAFQSNAGLQAPHLLSGIPGIPGMGQGLPGMGQLSRDQLIAMMLMSAMQGRK